MDNISIRPTKINKFIDERKQVVADILDILEISEEKNYIYIDELDTDLDKQNKILNLKDKILMYFLTSKWNCFKSCVKVDKLYLSYIKHVFKHENINFFLVRKMIKGVTHIVLTLVF